MVEEVRTDTGAIIDDENQVGGWPELVSAKAPTDSDDDGMPDNWETAGEASTPPIPLTATAISMAMATLISKSISTTSGLEATASAKARTRDYHMGSQTGSFTVGCSRIFRTSSGT